VGEAGGREIQLREELTGLNKELGRPASGDQQNLVEVDDTYDPMNKEASKAQLATHLEMDKHSCPAAARKRAHQDIYAFIGSDDYHSVNTYNNHNTCDTDDKDLQPLKRRKPCAAPAVKPAICHSHTPELRLGEPGTLVSLPPTTPAIDDVQPQADDGCPSTFVNNSDHYVSRTSHGPSAVTEAVPFAKY
jgi:hypothetical protein